MVFIKEWKTWAQKIAKIVRNTLPDAKVFVIGSIVKGDYVGGSDIDILIISKAVPERPIERSRIKIMIEDKLNLPYYHPFEIHILKPDEAKPYLRRAKERIEIVASG